VEAFPLSRRTASEGSKTGEREADAGALPVTQHPQTARRACSYSRCQQISRTSGGGGAFRRRLVDLVGTPAAAKGSPLVWRPALPWAFADGRSRGRWGLLYRGGHGR